MTMKSIRINSDEIETILKEHDKNYVGVQWAYFVDGPGNVIVFFWTTGDMRVACIGDKWIDGEDEQPTKVVRTVLWCQSA